MFKRERQSLKGVVGGVFVAWVAIASCMGLAACSSGVPDTVKIGVGVTLSGPLANRGQDLLDGAILAAEEINSDDEFKIKGRPLHLEIVAKDDKGEPETVKKVAHELVTEGVHAVIGHVNTPQTQLSVPIYAEAGIPNFFTSTHKSLVALGKGNAFRLVASDNVQARALATFATDSLTGRKITVIVESGDYGRDMASDMYAALQDAKHETFVAQRFEVAMDGKITPEIANRIRTAGADVIIVIGRETHTLSLLEQLKAVNYTKVSVLSANPAKTTRVMKTEIPVTGLYVTSTTVEPAELPGGQDFLSRFRVKFKSDPVWGAHYAYDAVYAIADAIRQTGTVDGSTLSERFKSAAPNTRVVQYMRFSSSGEQKHGTIAVYRVVNGLWELQMRSDNW
jgi:branched-chain amino acid transport system substrate-binding protein